MIKLFVSSFYNTIINEEDAIPTSTMFEIDRVKQKGIQLCILTNRLAEDVLYYNQDYPFIDYIISLNGGVITHVSTGTTETLKSFTKKELDEITSFYKGKEIEYYTQTTKVDRIPQEPVYKIEVKGTKKVCDGYFCSLLQMDKEKILEISKNTVWDALKRLNKKEEILAVIGNESEAILLETIPKTYVVRNAPKSLKEKTTHMTKSNKQKGVENVLKAEIK